ncbi:hypothetical protein GP475_04025 [Corynebacterium poyangense]|uniref:Uncharacterized protein n=1 Tax=Corynebacterium poyangense TaxID=2684405 RepID=A0A7H0SMY2_9CORY|nr:hypothetical protein [Corynebacterium poyangense]MBZ8176261.1 hypothetical protein [Corynebacterium poyangense]QNQ89907.1 hypothetical protein GP475_04025 [Corynebacterium poyangense]
MRSRHFLALASLFVLASAGLWIAGQEIGTILLLLAAALLFWIGYSLWRPELRERFRARRGNRRRSEDRRSLF